MKHTGASSTFMRFAEYYVGDWMHYCRNKGYQVQCRWFQCLCEASLGLFASRIMNPVLIDWSEDALLYIKSNYTMPFLSKVQTTKRDNVYIKLPVSGITLYLMLRKHFHLVGLMSCHLLS